MINADTIYGFFTFVFLAAVPCAAVLGLIVQPIYRRAITRAMMRASDVPESAFTTPEAGHPNAADLSFDTEPLAAPQPLRKGLGLRYFGAGLAFAFVATCVTATFYEAGVSPLRLAVIFAAFGFPAAIMALYVAGLSLRWLGLTAALWLGGLALLSLDALWFLGMLVGPALILSLIVGNPRLRTTAIPLFFVAVALIVALVLSLEVIKALLESNLLVVLYDVFPGAIANLLHVLLGLALALGVGVGLASVAVRFIAYVTAHSSEFMMQQDLVWLFLCFWLMNVSATAYGADVLVYLLAFVAYRATLRLLRPRGAATEVNLLLRVFGQQHTQRDLARGILLDWRREGPVLLIGAADLATETLDAPELAAFLNRRLDTIFIESPEDLEAARSGGTQRLGDGLFAMQDYYCRDNSWRPTILTLMSQARRILIDMRGFDPANQGIQFEIDALAERVASDRITIIAEEARLGEVKARFEKAWARAGRPGAQDRIKVRLA